MSIRDALIAEHEMAAGYHYGALIYLEENPSEREVLVEMYGDEKWHWMWYEIHAQTVGYLLET